MNNNKNKAILLMIISALGFALMSTFVKLSGDLPAIEKSFFRNIISFLVALCLILKNKSSFIGKPENRFALLGRSILGTLGIICNYYAIDHLILADANMLNKLSPFFVIVFSYLFLREKITTKQILALSIAFLGSLFIIKPSFVSDMTPALIGVLSALFAGGAYTFVRYLGGKEEGATIVFIFSTISSLVTLPSVLLNFELPSSSQIFYLILAGICACISQFSLTNAYKFAPAKEISIYDYSQVIFSAAIGFTLFGQIPDNFSLLGYFAIISASIYMFILNGKAEE